MTDTTKSNQERRDRTQLFSLAANCSLYEEDPQPARIDVGSRLEPKMVTSSEAWREYYSRHLVQALGGDGLRVRAVKSWAEAELPTARRSVRGSSVFGDNEWRIAIELCDRSLHMIEQAGADLDEFARERLLAGVDSSLTSDTLGFIPGVTEDAGEDLAARLEEIDDAERRS